MTQTNREYAEALYELALGDQNLEEVSSALELVEQELDGNPGYQALLTSPAISRKDRLESLEKVFGGQVPLSVLTLLKLMVSRGHGGQLKEMIAAWRDMEREHRGESIARVTSAFSLTEDQLEALRERLEKIFSRKMKLECSVDPALIGGVRVETEGRVMDGSLRSKLQQIKEVMDS